MPDITLRGALKGFGRVYEVSRDFWRVESFEGVESTTRIFWMTPRPGVSLESLPHQLQLTGASTFVVVPERASLCLRCHRTGHLRNNCVAPKCDARNNFGHLTGNCVRTYVTAVTGASPPQLSEDIMDETEAEAASASIGHRANEEAKSPSKQSFLP